MAEFLKSLDQWALQVLMMVYHLLGVQDLPKQPDPHWQVIERWTPQPDGHYRLVLESSTIQEECKSGRAKYIIFPQTYMAKQEVYADEVRVYTNEMDEEWHLRSFLDRPVLSCDLIIFAKKVQLINYSYLKYYTSINGWHKIAKTYPREHIFYNIVYVLVGILSAFVSVICFLIMIFLREKNYNVLCLGFFIYVLMFAHYPGYAVDAHIRFMHLATLISIIGIAYVVLFENEFTSINNKSHLYFILYIIFNIYISNVRENINQVQILFNAFFALSIMLVRAFQKKYDFEQRAVYFITSVLCFRDLYTSQKYRDGFLNLTLSCLILILMMAARALLKIYRKNINFTRIEEKYRSEAAILEKLRDVNLKIKQIVHDMKSPVTSLNFLLKVNDFSKDILLVPIQRLNNLVNLSSGESHDLLTDWYSVVVLKNELSKVQKEKSYAKGEIKVFFELINESVKIFFDPDSIKVIFAELIDNTIKNNSDKTCVMSFVIKLSKDLDFIYIDYFDNGKGVDKESFDLLGAVGYSTSGTGFGIFNIHQRVDSWGGSFKILFIQNGFKCRLTLACKQ